MTGTEIAGRRYRGRDAAQRQQERRTRLIQSGLDLFGTVGYASVSVKQVCSHAELTERYFYESFRDREDFFVEVYNDVITTIRAETAEAVAAAAPQVDAQLRAGLEAFIRTLTSDARMARLALIEVVGASPRLEVRRREVLHEFAALVTAVVGPLPGPEAFSSRLTMTAMSLVGGVNELLVDWTLGHQDATVEELIDQCHTLFIAAYRAISDVRPSVWIFHGDRARQAAGAFTTRAAGLAWAAEHHVTGILAEYPIGGAYDVAVAENRFTPTRPHHGTPDHVAGFSPGGEHVHLTDGQP